MNSYADPSMATKWCHVVCTTYRRRQLFKIPAHARFCERCVTEACTVPGWSVDAVAVAPDGMHLLLRIPAVASRADVAQRVLTAASAVARRAGVVRPWHHRLWQEPAWCAFVRNGTAVSHLRRQITSRKAVRTAGSAAD